jgi:hypothetical protein
MGFFDKSTSSTQTTSGTTNITGNRTGTGTSTSSGTRGTNTSGTRQNTTAPWIDDLLKDYGGDVGALDSIDPKTLVPGASPLQSKAFMDSLSLGGTAEAFGGGMNMAAGVGNAAAPRTEFAKSNPLIQGFMDPEIENVVNTSLADFDFGAGQTRAQTDLDLAGAGAFGGSGAAITKSMTEGELARGRGSLSANLRSNAYQNALAAAQNEATRKQGANDLNARLYGEQADRTLNAASTIGDLAATYGGEKRADTALTADLGAEQRSIEGQQSQALLDFLATRGGLLNNIPFDVFGGETYGETGNETTAGQENTTENVSTTGTTTENSTTKSKGKNGASGADMAGQALQVAALFAGSDRTIKTDITRLSTRPDGLGVYLFRYANDIARELWGDGWKVGVMAQEVLKVKPEAVARHPAGFLMVDYAQL